MNFLVLAGGENKRLGKDKAHLTVRGIKVLDRIINELEKVRKKKEQIILVGRKDFSPSIKNHRTGKIVEDIIPGKGPLGGIYSGLSHSNAQFNLAIACDMPFLQWDFIEYMRSLVENCDILIPYHSRGLEPLHAIYSKTCIPEIEKKLRQKKYKIQEVLPCMKVKFIGEKEIRIFAPPERLFFNINTEKDLSMAHTLIEEYNPG